MHGVGRWWTNPYIAFFAAITVAFILWQIPWPAIEAGDGDFNGKDLLSSMWQVQAGLIAVAFTVVLFVYERASSRNGGASVRDVSDATGLFPVLFGNFAALILTGATLTLGGDASSVGAHATGAIIGALVSLGLLVFFAVRGLYAIDETAFTRRRSRNARQLAVSSVEAVIFGRMSHRLLDALAKQTGVDFDYFGPSPRPGDAIHMADRDGVVFDINFRILESLIDTGKTVSVFGPLDRRVRQGTVLARASAGMNDIERQLRRAVRVRPASKDHVALREFLAELREEARLVTGPSLSPRRYVAILHIYEEMLLTLPETWTRYGFELPSDLGDQVGLFERSFADEIRRSVLDDTRRFARSDLDVDFMREVIEYPRHVVASAIDRRALALVRFALGASVAQVGITFAESSDSKWVNHQLFILDEIARFYGSYPLIDDTALLDDRLFAGEVLLACSRAIGDALKVAVDATSTDASEQVRTVVTGWNKLLRNWHPEFDMSRHYPREKVVAVSDGEAAAIAKFDQRKAAMDALASAKLAVTEDRAADQVGLLLRIIHRLETEPGAPERVVSLRTYFRTITATFSAPQEAIDALTVSTESERVESDLTGLHVEGVVNEGRFIPQPAFDKALIALLAGYGFSTDGFTIPPALRNILRMTNLTASAQSMLDDMRLRTLVTNDSVMTDAEVLARVGSVQKLLSEQ